MNVSLVLTFNLIMLKAGLNFLPVLIKGDQTENFKVTVKYMHSPNGGFAFSI